jgi:excisionase family DNA binding protein
MHTEGLRWVAASLLHGGGDASGRQGVLVVNANDKMTLQQAADTLLVSRGFLIGLLDNGRIPHRRVGTKRRLLLSDVLAYKANEYKRRSALLDELAAEGQKLGLY